MLFGYSVKELSESLLLVPLLCLFFGSIFLSFKTGFVQLRMLPHMVRLLFKSLFRQKKEGEHTVLAHKALFTAMSTTIGIGNIVSPAVVIRLGGPGALLGFLIAIFFGAATNFVEVTLAMHYRTKREDGSYSGGPMEYLRQEFHPKLAAIYAFLAAILLMVWSSNQANTLADILQTYGMPTGITGLLMAGLVTFYLMGGIKKIGNLSAKLVPFMFLLYCGAALWIIALNIERVPAMFGLMFESFCTAHGATGVLLGYGWQKMLRWGIANGIYASEAGIGTATIPHSESGAQNAFDQGVLSMVSAYSIGFICLLSGLVILLTGTWQDPSVSLGINMVAVAFAQYFPASSIILVASVFLFAFGTILGNSFNGSQCYVYLTKNRGMGFYYILVAAIVYIGSIFDVELLWTIKDFFVVPVALINLFGIIVLACKRKDIFTFKK
ncbi:amino acid carrier protein [Candidatus Babeliales bacterium]|nr:amino acid carrier protein [Candidatus Babeliales bacterium]